MKKKYLLLALSLVCVLAVSMLGGCACGKESKFVGTWKERNNYGEAQNKDEGILLGKWQSEKNSNSFSLYDSGFLGSDDDSTKISNGFTGKVWSIITPNDSLVIDIPVNPLDCIAVFDYQKGSNYYDSNIYYYDKSNDLLVYEGGARFNSKTNEVMQKITSYNGDDIGTSFHRVKDEDDNRLYTLVLNSDHTGTYGVKNHDMEITWRMSSNNDPNTIVIFINGNELDSKTYKYDEEKGILVFITGNQDTSNYTSYYEKEK